MNRWKRIIILALPLLFLGLIPLSLAAPPGQIPWKGTRINLFGPGKQIISSSDYSYVAHGWGPDDPWSEMSGEDRAFFKGPSLWFELETDPATFEGSLRPVTITYIEFDWVARFWGIQFKPGDLTPGEYSFTGTWYWDYEVAPPVKKIKLIVTP